MHHRAEILEISIIMTKRLQEIGGLKLIEVRQKDIDELQFN